MTLDRDDISTVIIFIVLCCVFVYWSEDRLAEHDYLGKIVPLPVSAEDVGEHDHDGRLVAVTGKATTPDMLTDYDFAVTFSPLRMQRIVEMYQWVEWAEQDSDAYHYELKWSEFMHDSRMFEEQQEGRKNPDPPPFRSLKLTNTGIHVGRFELPEELIQELPTSQFFTDFDPNRFDSEYQSPKAKMRDGYYYVKGYSNPPGIGDIRVAFQYAPQTEVTIIAEKQGYTFKPFKTSAGPEIYQISVGKQPVAEKLAPPLSFTWERGGSFVVLLVLTTTFVVLFVFGWPTVPQLLCAVTLAVSAYGIAAGLAWKPYVPLMGWKVLLADAGLGMVSVGALYKLPGRENRKLPGRDW